MALVNLSQIMDKDIFVSKSVKEINVRRGASITSNILGTVKKGERIGRVYTWVYGYDAKGNKDQTQIWLQLYEKYNNPSGFGAYVKLAPYVLDEKSLREQGVKTVAEIKKEEEEKKDKEDDSWLDTLGKGLGKGLKKVAPWILVAYLGGKAIEGRASRPKQKAKA